MEIGAGRSELIDWTGIARWLDLYVGPLAHVLQEIDS